MKIIKVVVDKLPESALACDFANHEWEHASGKVSVECECDHAQCSMTKVAFITRRCSACPLAEEAEEEQKMSKVLSHEAMSLTPPEVQE